MACLNGQTWVAHRLIRICEFANFKIHICFDMSFNFCLRCFYFRLFREMLEQSVFDVFLNCWTTQMLKMANYILWFPLLFWIIIRMVNSNFNDGWDLNDFPNRKILASCKIHFIKYFFKMKVNKSAISIYKMMQVFWCIMYIFDH